jgi:parallel beta-helix repeat protein
MTEDRSRALVPQVPGSISVVSRLAERTLAERSARSDTLAVVGRTLVVGPGGYETVGEAVALARDGDTVLVRPGTYRESVTITRAITLRGDGDRDDIVIEFDGEPCLVLENSAARLANLTIRSETVILGGSPNLERLVLGRGICVKGGASPIIRGCVLRGDGIFLEEGSNGAIEDNEISGHDWAGIWVVGPGTAPLVRGNRIHDGADSGIRLEGGAGGTVERNDIYDITGSAIRVEGAGTAPIIRANLIHDGRAARSRDERADGIAVLDGAGGSIEDNDIFGDDTGVTVEGTGSAPLIRGNRIVGCQANGITIGGRAVPTIEGNDISGSVGAGIEVTGAGTAPVILTNRIHDGHTDGISVWDGADATIEGNDIFGNADSGINVFRTGTALLIVAKVARDVGSSRGLSVCSLKIEPNGTFANLKAGASVVSGGTVTLVRGNRIHDCHGNGLWVGAGALIEDNDIHGNAEAGILVQGSGTAPLIRANQIHDGEANGIEVRDRAAGQIIGNTIRRNRGVPILCEPGASPDLVANTILASESSNRDLYGPNSKVVESFIGQLHSLSADVWATVLAPWVYRSSRNPKVDPILAYRPGANMLDSWEQAYLLANRLADPDRTKAWTTTSEEAKRAVIEAVVKGMVKFVMSRPDEHWAWAAGLPDGGDSSLWMFMREGKSPAEALDAGRAAQAVSLACSSMAGSAACALVVKDHLPPEMFELLYAPFASLIPASSL